MHKPRPHRLAGVSYIGYQRYFITTCSDCRRVVFTSPASIDEPLWQLRQCARLFEFEITAYCFMPDHLHLLVTAQSEQADLPAFMKRFKQLTGYAHKRAVGETLWQVGYHDRILRDDEATTAVARYIFENPIRAGLTRALFEYPLAGSDVYDNDEFLSAWELQQT